MNSPVSSALSHTPSNPATSPGVHPARLPRSRPAPSLVREPDPPGRSQPASRRLQVGRAGEELAARYLTDQGWQILERNWRRSTSPRGELDLIAHDPGHEQGTGTLVAVEVKTRTSLAAGYPAEAVGRAKRRRLARLLMCWVREHQARPERVRVDVVSVLLRTAGPAQIRHHRGVTGPFEAEGGEGR